ncbi:conjugative relaxase-like TrwC/TraI family protein [Bosea sp. BE271]|nr:MULTISPECIES: MobF family relaxase [Bosea]MDR6828966.1 conjugative relaxase-like TrwC/TraI family protein [Bosea robiniae]MDR6895620.1 conjugative relaxase-like TrwC/TraI family protein [Bosea sp. BE109]MDR7139015.1 conjugative relaxase-like TrwC/TraI family protein [Bosea sp. BE168]MDR7175946.1 conjugative relaxase-like TrwC/TraI family protein [Bosea sp. BE271]
MLFRQFYAPTGGVANAPVLNGLSTMVKSPLENWAPTCLIPQIVCNLFGGRYRHRQLNDRDEVGGFCVAVSDNAAFVASYYYQEAGLAARDDLANGVWYAPDIRMKVPNGTPVSEADLREVLKRRLPWTNETGPAKRESKQKTPTKKGSASIETTSARDISFSVPKSVSLVWALGTPDIRMKIEEAQHRAVKRAMDLFFQNVALERIGNSKEQKTRPAIAFCALFLHGTSRNAKRDDGKLHPDPNLHTHAIVPDIIRSQDGRLKILFDRGLKHWKFALAAWHFAALAYELRSLGFAIEAVGNDGRFRLAGVSAQAVQRFSKRTIGAKDFASRVKARQRAGLTTSLALSMTRAPKQDFPVEDLLAAWGDEAVTFDIDVSDVAASAMRRHNRPQREPSDKKKQRTVERALARATEHEAVFRRERIAQVLASQLVIDGVYDNPSMELLDQTASASSLLHRLADAQNYRLAQWTTASMLALEAEAAALAFELSQSPFARAPTIAEAVEAASEALFPEQKSAATLACSDARLVLINGAPGTGKTTMLKPVVAAYQEAGFKVIATAEAWRVCLEMGTDCAIKFASLTTLLGHKGRELGVDSRTVLIVDEVGLLGTERMVQLLRLAKERGAKLVMIGDPSQLRPIAAGSGYRLIHPFAKSASLMTVHRQVGWYRKAAAAIVSGNTAEGLHDMDRHNRVQHIKSSAEATAKAVDWLEKEFFARGHGPSVAIVKTNDEVHEISQAFRQKLQLAGALKGEVHRIAAMTPNGIRRTLELQDGDLVRFQRRSRVHPEIVNGSVARVVAITRLEDGDLSLRLSLRIKLQGKNSTKAVTARLSEWHDENGDAHVGHAYVSTLYGLQGATIAKGLLILDGDKLDERDLYVGLTRARHETLLLLRSKRKKAWYSEEGPAALPHEKTARQYVRELHRSPDKVLARECLPQAEPAGDMMNEVQAPATAAA